MARKPTTTETTNRITRPTRVPLHEQRDKLTVRNRNPDLEYRWVNDVDDRILKFKQAGWEPAPKTDVGDPAVETGDNNTSSINEKHVGGRTKAVLMQIPKEWYNEDQAAKMEAVRASELAMQREALSNFAGNKNPELKVGKT